MKNKEIRHIFLIGFMGTGKSTVSRYLSEKLGIPRFEADEEIEKEAGMRISDIFETYGEEHFRDMESAWYRALAARPAAIVSCGGGAVLRAENVACMKENGKILLLSGSPETVYERVRHNNKRPLLNGHMNVEYIAQLMEKRRDIYAQACDKIFCIDARTSAIVADEIAEYLKEIGFGHL